MCLPRSPELRDGSGEGVGSGGGCAFNGGRRRGRRRRRAGASLGDISGFGSGAQWKLGERRAVLSTRRLEGTASGREAAGSAAPRRAERRRDAPGTAATSPPQSSVILPAAAAWPPDSRRSSIPTRPPCRQGGYGGRPPASWGANPGGKAAPPALCVRGGRGRGRGRGGQGAMRRAGGAQGTKAPLWGRGEGVAPSTTGRFGGGGSPFSRFCACRGPAWLPAGPGGEEGAVCSRRGSAGLRWGAAPRGIEPPTPSVR